MNRVVYNWKHNIIIAIASSEPLAEQIAEGFSYVQNGNANWGFYGIRLITTEVASRLTPTPSNWQDFHIANI